MIFCNLEDVSLSKRLLSFIKVTIAIRFGTNYEWSEANLDLSCMYECDVLLRNASVTLTNILDS
jgi:hypothetical protein